MKIASKQLIDELIEITKNNQKNVENLEKLTDFQLNYKENSESWSVLECLKHLNLYADFYNQEIKLALKHNETQPDNFFKSGFLGNYFATSMLPKENLNKMKTFKDKNPINSTLTRNVIDVFIKNQKTLLDLLLQAQNANLNKIKIVISITNLLKIKLGDTFRFVIYHNLRHIKQIDKILKSQKIDLIKQA